MLIKILLVTGSSSDRWIIKEALKDYSVLTACDGLEATDILNENDSVNLLILDLDSPNINAGQVLEFIKKDERFRNMRILALTNGHKLDDEIKALKLCTLDYIRKPINMDLLKARIGAHVAILCMEQRLQEQLRRQKLSFDMIIDQAPIGIAIAYSCDSNDFNEETVRINSMYQKITGRTKDELISLGWANITHPDDLEEDLENFRKLQAGEIKSYSMDKRYIKPDGSIIWVHKVVTPFTLSNDEKNNHICWIQDITQLKALEKALDESQRSTSTFLSHLPGFAYRCNYDYDWTMQYVSQGCFNLTGYPPESLLYNRDLSFNDLIAPEYQEILRQEWERILPKRQVFNYEYEIITAAGQRKWVLEMGQGVYNQDGEVEALEGIILDISDRKLVEERLKYDYEHDRWTGLYNRDYLVSLLEKDAELKKGSKRVLIGISLSMVELLTVKYGFQYTQNLIKNTAEILSRFCGHNRLLFYPRENRFVFYLLDYNDKKELINFSSAIRQALKSLFITEGIGGRIGVLEIGQNQDEACTELLLRRLSIVSEMRNNVHDNDFEICFYDEELEAMVDRERDIEKALGAIVMNENTKDSLFLQYQPILNLKTGSIFGFEVLSRLRTQKQGLVSPLEFIPIAEKTKLIIPLGEKIIAKAFRFLKKLEEFGYDELSVSINISVIQLLHPQFTTKLLELMRNMQVDPKKVGIEITESIFISDFDNINHVIEKLRKVGLYIAIDDFGTGYSSLSREEELEVNYVKIDKYFIDKLLNTEPNKAILSDIISMSHKLGHYTIAEGVEHDIQLEYLKKHNCDKIQGYLISKPLHEKEAFEFLKKNDKTTVV